MMSIFASWRRTTKIFSIYYYHSTIENMIHKEKLCYIMPLTDKICPALIIAVILQSLIV